MSKGGMRFGAGRPGYKVKSEQTQRLTISRWHKEGYLRAGNVFTWAWDVDGKRIGSIGVQVHHADALTLQYAIGTGSERRVSSQWIGIAHTSCHFGNSRPWFACPCCTRRAGVLYLRWGRFACRHCQNVAYASQSSDALDRTWIKQHKLEARLGAHLQRPKGMRRHTYDSLLTALEDCEERRERAFCAAAMRLFGHKFENGLMPLTII